MKTIIGITTWNRKKTLQLSVKSLQHAELAGCEVRIYDDASDEYDISFLKKVMPGARVRRNKRRLGADGNMINMYEDFVKSDGDLLINADADLLYRADFVSEAVRLLEQTDGVLSLFNTANHIVKAECGELVEKYDIGAAGTVFRRDVLVGALDKIKSALNEREQADWTWSRVLRESGCRIMVAKASLVQHIGLRGVWSSGQSFDYGEGFIVDEVNGQLLNEVVLEISNGVTARMRRAAAFYKVGKYLEAAAETRAGLELAPDNAALHFNLGCELWALGDKKKARKHLKRAYELEEANDLYKKNYEAACSSR